MFKRMAESGPDSGGRVKGVNIIKPIVYGNVAQYFGKKRKEEAHPLQESAEHLGKEFQGTAVAQCGREVFGDNYFREWASLFQHYSHLPFICWEPLLLIALELQELALGWILGCDLWHKHWFLYPLEKTSKFHPNKTTLTWLRDTYPVLEPSERPLECTIPAGEVLYFPDHWWHATFNLDTSVFISTFLG
ncbi:JmjC domain-containing protein 8 [Heterocephalus glaber]|uniref:JmjC domain-containing protein 8 n=1 Tax=Heterocephalus glaber TaxID=10181 RepID=G5C2J7_HETGA|nr:JmjC domain-containing protein 8 [Heterocephalus glaber]